MNDTSTMESNDKSKLRRPNHRLLIQRYCCCGGGGGGGAAVCCSRQKKWILFLLLIVALQLFHFVWTPKPPLTLPTAQPWELPSESLQAVVFFKEESHVIIELVLHLYSQGFSHVRLIDNESEHELPVEVLKLLRDDHYGGIVSTTTNHHHDKYVQPRSYRRAGQRLRFLKQADWILPVDADEFPWATQVGSLLNYVLLQDDEVCTITLPWQFFGSNSREDQPSSILQGFVKRRDFSKHPVPVTRNYKTVGRTSCTLWPAIHHAGMLRRHSKRQYNSLAGLPHGMPMQNEYMEAFRPEAVVAHYRSQSHQFWKDIKMVRGGAISGAKGRTEAAFQNDQEINNDILDEGIAILARRRFSALYGEKKDNDKDTMSDNDLTFRHNPNLLNPWPLENVKAALEQMRRHQVLAILDATSSLPDALGRATRNAAILDPTWDCVVRIAPGHAESAVASKVTKLCAVVEARPTEQTWHDFVQWQVSRHCHRYTGFVAMDMTVLLAVGSDTSALRVAATSMNDDDADHDKYNAAANNNISSKGWRVWKNGNDAVEAGSVQLVPRSCAK
jgi:hypothetical protein